MLRSTALLISLAATLLITNSISHGQGAGGDSIRVVQKISLVNQGNFEYTPIFTPHTTGLYRIQAYVESASYCRLGGLLASIKYYDEHNNPAAAIFSSTPLFFGSLVYAVADAGGNLHSGSIPEVIRAVGGTPISLRVNDISGGTICQSPTGGSITGTYSMFLVIEAI